MSDRPVILSAQPPAQVPPQAARLRPQAFGWFLAVLVLVFALPLYELVRFSLSSDLYSYIPLIPGISLYMIWLRRHELSWKGTGNRLIAAVLLGVGALLLLGYWIVRSTGTGATVDALALAALAFVAALAGVCTAFLGRSSRSVLLFPLAFLLFITPIPTALLTSIETFMQHGSAAVSRLFFALAGTPIFYDRLIIQLPGITLHVAPECSGIRSTLVLLIVSVFAGWFFLRSVSSRSLLVLAIIPLALLRNGFRIFVIGELCVRIGPEMIHSYIHRSGGPIFFALSLVPLMLLMLLLRWRDRRVQSSSGKAPQLTAATST